MKTNVAELFCCFESSQLLFTVSYVNGPDEAKEKQFWDVEYCCTNIMILYIMIST